jgi:hypothetical protein
MSGGGGGSADAHTSLNQARQLGGRGPRRWGPREWVWFGLALLPLVVVAIVAWLL